MRGTWSTRRAPRARSSGTAGRDERGICEEEARGEEQKRGESKRGNGDVGKTVLG